MACGSDLLIAIFDDSDNRGQETAHKRCRESPNVRMRIHDLWERSPDRDLR